MRATSSIPKRLRAAVMAAITVVIAVVAGSVAMAQGTLFVNNNRVWGPGIDQPGLLEELDGSGALVREIIHAVGQPLWQIRASGPAEYFHGDGRGNVVALSDSAGNIVERVVYDTFGKPVLQDAANNPVVDFGSGNFAAESAYDNSNLFGGGWYLPELGQRSNNVNTDRGGMYRIGSRFYNPDEGRFTSRSTDAGILDVADYAVRSPGFESDREQRYVAIRRPFVRGEFYFNGRFLSAGCLRLSWTDASCAKDHNPYLTVDALGAPSRQVNVGALQTVTVGAVRTEDIGLFYKEIRITYTGLESSGYNEWIPLLSTNLPTPRALSHNNLKQIGIAANSHGHCLRVGTWSRFSVHGFLTQ